MNKICTSLEQSKKLIELGIDVNTADMEYMFLKKDGSKVSSVPFVKDGFEEPECCYIFIPCWSLSALLAQMPCVELVSSNDGHYRAFWHEMYSEWHTNAVDACVELLKRK